ncbi:hypothetical protein V498_05514 [Pseudogymnoascus sp. VKM F-4517 (FW-2822)]|nr:hypothetical protein V498_05514 [Pseudogymnoascus sp. VKM F-4517 (FW-2822)]
MIDAAGFHFVVSTPGQTQDKHARKAVRSHATKAGGARQQGAKMRSWISPNRELGSLKLDMSDKAPTPASTLSISSPRRIGSDFSGLQLPIGIEPHMIQELVKLIDINKYGVYPYEICLHVHPVERGWFPYMISDLCCLHSMMFLIRAFTEGGFHAQLSRRACLHYAKTLQLLQARLNEFDLTAAISDTTIMVVFLLASVAELMEDYATVGSHIKGLEKIVHLRGGVQALNTHNNMQAKVCRADLSYALLSGQQPRFFRDEIQWSCFIANRGLIQCSHQPHDAYVHAFLEATVDKRLHNALRDLHTFSCISNLAYETTRKLSPDIYNEMMTSILYRLTNLSFESDPLQEALRVGLLAVSSTIFMQRQFAEHPYDHLLNLQLKSLLKLREFTDTDIPVPIVLWLTILLHALESNGASPDWLSAWLDEVIFCAGIKSWHQAHSILRSMVWVNFVHDRCGMRVFEAAMLRLEKERESESKKFLDDSNV